MSLHDRYNRDDGRIQRMDRRFTELANRFGNGWYEITGISRNALTKGLYLVSAFAIVQHYMLYKDFTLLLFLLIAVFGFNGVTQNGGGGGLVDQIQAEVAGLPKNTIPFLRLMILMLGLLALATGVIDLVALELNATVVASDIGRNLLLAVALLTVQFSDYIRRSTPPTNSRGGNRRTGKLIKSTAPSR